MNEKYLKTSRLQKAIKCKTKTRVQKILIKVWKKSCRKCGNKNR